MGNESTTTYRHRIKPTRKRNKPPFQRIKRLFSGLVVIKKKEFGNEKLNKIAQKYRYGVPRDVFDEIDDFTVSRILGDL